MTQPVCPVQPPASSIEPGIVFRQERIARVAKNALHKVQIAHEDTRRKEADFHGLLLEHAGHFRTDDRTQQLTNKGAGLPGLWQAGGVGQREEFR